MKDKHQASPTPEEIIQEICNRYNRLKESSSADNDTIRLTERGIGHCKGIRG